MRPGPLPWATNDTFVAGPSIGSQTKLTPPTLLKEDGRYLNFRPGPDTHNWMMNRLGLLQGEVSRMRLLSQSLVATDTTDHQGGDVMASCHVGDTASRKIFIFATDNVVGSVEEIYSLDGITWSQPASSPCTATVGVTGIDADGDNSGMRMIVCDDGGGSDLVLHNSLVSAASWASVTFTAGGPTLDWISIGCDRGAAGSDAAWCIGDDQGGANSVLWTSLPATPTTFAVAAAWPGGTVQEPLFCIGHSNHHAGALGPDDLGNESWLVLSDTYATKSSDGTIWSAAAHTLALAGGSFNHRSVAYSRTSARWVAVLPAATAGDVAYSDDNGATWTTIASALPGGIGAGDEPSICCDGYGSFLVTLNGGSGSDTYYYVSTDEGLTWTRHRLPSTFTGLGAGTLDGCICEAAFDESVDVDGVSDAACYFTIAIYDDSAVETEIFQSLTT